MSSNETGVLPISQLKITLSDTLKTCASSTRLMLRSISNLQLSQSPLQSLFSLSGLLSLMALQTYRLRSMLSFLSSCKLYPVFFQSMYRLILFSSAPIINIYYYFSRHSFDNTIIPKIILGTLLIYILLCSQKETVYISLYYMPSKNCYFIFCQPFIALTISYFHNPSIKSASPYLFNRIRYFHYKFRPQFIF